MIEDPVVNEIRKHRQVHAERYGNDLHRIVEALRDKQKQSNSQIVNRGPKALPNQQVS